MALVNTSFKKEEKCHITYVSESRWAQVDHILCKCDLKEVGDCKVVAREDLARPHLAFGLQDEFGVKEEEGQTKEGNRDKTST